MSKGLDTIKYLQNHYHKWVIDLYYNSDMTKEERHKLYEKYDDDFEIIEKNLDALEILKNKNVNICLLKDCYNLEDYNNTCIYLGNYSNQISKSIPITEEEYDLLKEWLE